MVHNWFDSLAQTVRVFYRYLLVEWAFSGLEITRKWYNFTMPLFMKKLLSLSIIAVAFLFSCKKNAAGIRYSVGQKPIETGLVNSWRLVQDYGFVGPNPFVETPPADSTVLFIFSLDNMYTSFLKGQAVRHGSFSVEVDPFATGWNYLQLTNFDSTGVVWSSKEYLESNGQLVLSDTSQLVMNISHDTLILSPDYGGYDAQHFFVFLKQ